MPAPSSHSEPARVLVVEDHPGQLRTLMGLLEQEGFPTVGCDTGAKALDQLERQSFGVAVVDLQLPDMRGTQLLDRIRPAHAGLRIIINTGNASLDSAKEAINLGAFAYVEKADDPKELVRHVRRAIRGAASSSGTAEACAPRNESAAVRDQDQLFRTLVEQFREIVWISDPERNQWLYVSPSYEETWGRRRDDLLTSPDVWLNGVHLEDRPRVRNAVRAPARGGRYAERFRVVRPDRTIRVVRDRAFPIANMAGTVHRIARITEDVTGLELLKEELREAGAMTPIGRLAGSLAHGFANYLTPILGFTELLQHRMAPDDPNLRLTDTIRMAAEQAAILTEELRVFSDHVLIPRRTPDLNALVRNLSGTLQRLLGDPIELVLDLASSSGPISARLDNVASILIHLALRARDAMPSGGRFTIETSGIERTASAATPPSGAPVGSYVALTVSEMGSSGYETARPDSFVSPLTTMEEDLRTALRLAMVHDIVKRAGAYFDVTGSPGQGLSIRVLFPLATNQHPADDAA